MKTRSRPRNLFLFVTLFLTVTVWAEDIDQEIIKNFEFFYHMEVVEDLDSLDQEQDIDSESSQHTTKEGTHARL